MKMSGVLRHPHRQSLPLLATARLKGRPESWPAEQLERLLTPREIDDLYRGHFAH
ncbi:hypothetical protein [Rhodococcus sp. NPDC127528]|uniref:hypothetical protein n=1 Tax=unclassified Rhodococcus (in: high G+C Gram-positive bacteria) TaxID=192944 RepID=UPI00363749AD